MVRLDHRAAAGHALEAGLPGQGVGNAPEGPRKRPAPEPLENAVVPAEPLRDVAPRRPRAEPPENRLHEGGLSAAVPPGSDFPPGSVSPVRAHMASVSTVLSAFILPPARLAHAAVTAVIGAGHGMEPDESQHDYRQALRFSFIRSGQLHGRRLSTLRHELP